MQRCAVALLTACHVATGVRKRRKVSSDAANKGSMPLDKALFMATHNSYEKKPMGIIQSFDFGVRQVELDIYIKDFSRHKQYCIGHFWCGEATQVGELGNPNTTYLNAWLEQIADWSRSHRDHSPISLLIDMKSDLASGGKTYAEAGFPNLQETFQGIFGDLMYWANEKPGGYWPSVNQLRGRIMVVLSGNRNSRIFYQEDKGRNPRVAVNDAGLVVETHTNQGGRSIYYWTGKMSGDTVSWFRKGKFDAGKDTWPVLLNDNTVVEVHKSENLDNLFFRVGRLDQASMEISWAPSVKYDSGKSPAIRLLPNGQLQERHISEWTGKVWTRNGTLDVARRIITWTDSKQVNLAAFDPVAISPSGSRRVEAKAQSDLLFYRTGSSGTFKKIAYEQMFFIDWQPGCDGTSENYPPLNQGSWIGVSRRCDGVKRMEGVATRVWQYNKDDQRNGKEFGSYPATDEPDAAYKSWVSSKSYGIIY